MTIQSNTVKKKIHYSKLNTLWCENGHTVADIVGSMLTQIETRIKNDESGEILIPICPICGGKINEGQIN